MTPRPYLGRIDVSIKSTKSVFRNALAAGVLALSLACTVYVRPPTGAVFVVREPPPPPREVIIVRPAPEHVWITGYYAWREPQYVWVPGRWTLPPAGYRTWVAGRWHREAR